jgi:hypothetical protein
MRLNQGSLRDGHMYLSAVIDLTVAGVLVAPKFISALVAGSVAFLGLCLAGCDGRAVPAVQPAVKKSCHL